MSSQDSVPSLGCFILNLDCERAQVLLDIIKIEGSVDTSCHIFIRVSSTGLISLFNKVTDKFLCLGDNLVGGIITTRSVRVVEEGQIIEPSRDHLHLRRVFSGNIETKHIQSFLDRTVHCEGKEYCELEGYGDVRPWTC